MRYRNREQAGQLLGQALTDRVGPDVLVLGLPRGGVPVAAQVASALNAPLDVMVVRKVGAPCNPEVALGAVASGGALVLNRSLVREAEVAPAELDELVARQRAELARRERLYRHGLPPPRLEGRTVVLVDDGIATGATMAAAVKSSRELGARRIVVAAPVASSEAIATLRAMADEVVCPWAPPAFLAVGAWYEDFAQLSDEEVRRCLVLPSTGEVGLPS